MFRPEGVCLDLGSGMRRYLAFERSNSMSRQSKLSFLREDVYHQVRRRIQMDMTIGDCQLSKLYAYNGLMLSSGVRLDGINKIHHWLKSAQRANRVVLFSAHLLYDQISSCRKPIRRSS